MSFVEIQSSRFPPYVLCKSLKTFQSLFFKDAVNFITILSIKTTCASPLMTEDNKIIFVKTKTQVINNWDAMRNLMFFERNSEHCREILFGG